jgi:hypothetical protein
LVGKAHALRHIVQTESRGAQSSSAARSARRLSTSWYTGRQVGSLNATDQNLCGFHDVGERPSRAQRKPIAPGQLLINGKWVDGVSGETIDVADATTESSITHV